MNCFITRTISDCIFENELQSHYLFLSLFEGQNVNERCTSDHQCKQSLSCEQNICKCVVNTFWNGSLCEPSMCYAGYTFTNAYVLISFWYVTGLLNQYNLGIFHWILIILFFSLSTVVVSSLYEFLIRCLIRIGYTCYWFFQTGNSSILELVLKK